MNLEAARMYGRATLGDVSPTAALDVDVLLAQLLDKSRTQILTDSSYELSSEQEAEFNAMLQRRLDREPVAYIVGEKEFWGLKFYVDHQVLVPRSDTELLVELALKHLENVTVVPRILDLGTGSGCVAIALADSLRKLEREFVIEAVDYSDQALMVAKQNASTHFLDDNVSFYKSDWFTAVGDSQFDLIVSNPPYIADADSYTSPELQFEPSMALYAGVLGLDSVKNILKDVGDYLTSLGVFMFEHGSQQAELIRATCSEELKIFRAVDTFKDLAGLDRVTVCRI